MEFLSLMFSPSPPRSAYLVHPFSYKLNVFKLFTVWIWNQCVEIFNAQETCRSLVKQLNGTP